MDQRLAIDVARFESRVDLRVVPPLCPVQVSPADFSQSAQLIERSHKAARQWLSSRHPVTGQAALLEAHRH